MSRILSPIEFASLYDPTPIPQPARPLAPTEFANAYAPQLDIKRIQAVREEQPQDLSLLEGIRRGLLRGGQSIVGGISGGIRAYQETAGEADRRAAEAFGVQNDPNVQRVAAERAAIVDKARTFAAEAAARNANELAPSPAAAESLNMDNWRWWTENVAAAVPQLFGQAAIATTTGGSSLPAQVAAFAGTGGAMEAGLTYQDARARQEAKGIPDSQAIPAAAAEAGVSGAINSIIEIVPAGAILGKITGKTAKPAVSGAVKKVVKSILGEGAEESTQTAVSDAAQWLFENDPKAFDDWSNRYIGAGLIGGAAGGLAGGSSAVGELMQRRQQTPTTPGVQPADPQRPLVDPTGLDKLPTTDDERKAAREKAQAFYSDKATAIAWALTHPEAAAKLAEGRRHSASSFREADPTLPELSNGDKDATTRREWKRAVEEYQKAPEELKTLYKRTAAGEINPGPLSESPDWQLLPPTEKVPEGVDSYSTPVGHFVKRKGVPANVVQPEATPKPTEPPSPVAAQPTTEVAAEPEPIPQPAPQLPASSEIVGTPAVTGGPPVPVAAVAEVPPPVEPPKKKRNFTAKPTGTPTATPTPEQITQPREEVIREEEAKVEAQGGQGVLVPPVVTPPVPSGVTQPEPVSPPKKINFTKKPPRAPESTPPPVVPPAEVAPVPDPGRTTEAQPVAEVAKREVTTRGQFALPGMLEQAKASEESDRERNRRYGVLTELYRHGQEWAESHKSVLDQARQWVADEIKEVGEADTQSVMDQVIDVLPPAPNEQATLDQYATIRDAVKREIEHQSKPKPTNVQKTTPTPPTTIITDEVTSDVISSQGQPGPQPRLGGVVGGAGQLGGESSTPISGTSQPGETGGLPGPQGTELRPSAGKTAEGAARPKRRGSKGKTGPADAGGNQPELAGRGTADTRGAEETPAVQEPVRKRNHIIEPTDVIAPRGDVSKLKANIRAIKLVKAIQTENREATPEEKKELAQYTGWGGLSNAFAKQYGEAMLGERYYARDENWEKKWGKYYKDLRDSLTTEEWEAARTSTLNAHYTSRPVIEPMWKAVEHLGFKGGKVSELGAGIGHFIGLAPPSVQGDFTAVERDDTSAALLRALYPDANVLHGDLNDVKLKPNSQDLVIGNVPFAAEIQPDAVKRYDQQLNLHNYFLARAIDTLKPGGLAAIITTHRTMDGPVSQRKFLADRAELVGAIRLPNDAFAENAGTEVVTDILFFRKPSGVKGGESWALTNSVDVGDKKAEVNEYFASHPEMVLGKHSFTGSMYQKDEYTVEPTKPLSELLPAAIAKLPANIAGKQIERTVASETDSEPDVTDDTPLVSGGIDVRGGDVYVGIGDKAVKLVPDMTLPDNIPKGLATAAGMARAKDYVRLRDTFRNVHRVMKSQSSTDGEVKVAQAELNRVYDTYVKAHGHFGEQKSKLFRTDSGYFLVRSLENRKQITDPKNKKKTIRQYKKAPIFTKRVIGPREAPVKADSVQDALHISSGYRGGVDLDYMAELTGKSPDEVASELRKNRMAFVNPVTGQWETKEKYLSGNVAQKFLEAEKAAEEDESYQENAKALKEVQPDRLAIRDISYNLGGAWIPQDVVVEFANELFGTRSIDVAYNRALDEWRVHSPVKNERITSEFGTADKTGTELLSAILNMKRPVIKRNHGTGDKPVWVVDEKATQEVKTKMHLIGIKFKEFVSRDSDMQLAMEDAYNKSFNNHVDPKYDGQHLTLPGASDEITLRPYQKSAIWRILQEGHALLAHAVGAGKTYTMVAAAMEMRRLGLAKRPMIVVQKATLGQFATSFLRLYPGANVLVASADDLSEKNRAAFLSRVVTGDWDAIVLAQSTFDNLPSDPETEMRFIQEQLNALEENIYDEKRTSGKKAKQKDIVRAREGLKKRLDEAAENMKKRKNIVAFEDLGVDALFIDEAHAYKKPPYQTKLEKLVGLQKQFSARGMSTLLKVRHIQQKMHKRNVVFATGTPITNTLGEAWHMLNFTNPEVLKDFDIETFDRFISAFADRGVVYEMNAGGKPVPKEAIIKFVNGPELMHLLRSSWDILSPQELREYMTASEEAGMPKLKGDKVQAVTVELTPGVKEFMSFLKEVYAKFRSLPGKSKRDWAFIPGVAYNAAKRASIDLRLLMPGAKFEGGKIQAAVDNAIQEYKDSSDRNGTQLIFSDAFNPMRLDTLRSFMKGEAVSLNIEQAEDSDKAELLAEADSVIFRDMKKRLVKGGIPEDQIAIIADYDTDSKREALFERVNAGDIRILMGSTNRMGVGVNVQERLVALHHLDAPWLPADVEQRDGRILRFGNINDEVSIYRYAMKRTLDSAIYDKVIRKAKFIWQALSGKFQGREFDDPASSMTMSLEEQQAAIQDDPTFHERVALEQEVRELELEREGHEDAMARARDRLSRTTDEIRQLEQTVIPNNAEYLELSNKKAALPMVVEIGGKKLTESKDITEAVATAKESLREKVLQLTKNKKLSPNRQISQTGKYAAASKVALKVGGYDVELRVGAYQFMGDDKEGWIADVRTYIGFPEKPETGLYRGDATTGNGIVAAVRDMPAIWESAVQANKGRLATLKADQEQLERISKGKWNKDAELAQKQSRLAELKAQIIEEARAEEHAEDAARQAKIKKASELGDEPPIVTSSGTFGGGQMATTAKPNRKLNLPDEAKSLVPEAQQRYEDAYGTPQKSWRDTVAERVDAFFGMLRSQRHLSARQPMVAAARDLIRTLQGGQKRAMDRAARDIARIVSKLTDEEYQVFNRAIVLHNLSDAIDDGEPARFGYGNTEDGFDAELARDQVTTDLDRIEKVVDANPVVKRAMEQREKIVGELVDELVENKLLPAAVKKDGRAYYHQQVFLYQQSDRFSKRLKPLIQKKSFQKKRIEGDSLGKAYDYNTNFIEAEISWMTDAFTALELKRTRDEIERLYDIKGDLTQKAKAGNFSMLVGGEKNVKRIMSLLAAIKESSEGPDSSESYERQRRKAMIEELTDLDPTYPYRKAKAQLMSKIRKDHPELDQDENSDDDSGSFWQALRAIAHDPKDPANVNAMAMFKQIQEEKEMIQKALGRNYLTWQKLADRKEGYSTWTADPNNVMYPVWTIPDRVMEQFSAGLIEQYQLTPEEVRQAFALGGPQGEMVIPTEIAKQLDSMRKNPKQDDVISKIVGYVTGKWKQLILLAPWRAIGYEGRNLIGDLDPIVATVNPLKLNTTSAFHELVRFYRQDDLPVSDRTLLARDLEVIDSGMTAQDMAEFQEMPAFDHLFEKLPDQRRSKFNPLQIGKNYWDWVTRVSKIREGTLRLALFNHLLDEHAKTGKWVTYGASYAPSVDAVEDALGPDRAAAKISRELVGDYGDISQVGAWMSRTIWPFWRFQEINLKRYPRLAINAFQHGTGLQRASTGVVMAARIAWLWGLAYLINHLMFPDEEDELPEYYQNNPHLTLGRRPDGSIRVLNNVGSLGDFLEWFGVNDLPMNVQRYQEGKVGGETVGKEVAKSFLGKVFGGSTPLIKTPLELLTGQSYFPDVTNPVPIRRDEAAANTVGLRDEWKLMRGKILGDGSSVRPHSFERWAGLSVVQPKKVMLDRMHAERNRFLEKNGQTVSKTLNISKWQNIKEAAANEDYEAFRNARKTLLADQDGGKAFDGFLSFIDKLDPLENRMNKKLEQDFIKTLDDNEKRELHVARDYARELGDLLVVWWETASREDDTAAQRSQYRKELTKKRQQAYETSSGKGRPKSNDKIKQQQFKDQQSKARNFRKITAG